MSKIRAQTYSKHLEVSDRKTAVTCVEFLISLTSASTVRSLEPQDYIEIMSSPYFLRKLQSVANMPWRPVFQVPLGWYKAGLELILS